MTVVTRFPPSPTGFLHIGNARTALFNWCFARHHNGKFLLRIEDTDKERSTQAAIDAIFEAMDWMGLDHDNEEVIYQSARADRHAEVAQELLEKGMAYKCFCTQEELQAMREDAKAKGENPGYNGLWRDRDPSEAPEGAPFVIRLKAPKDGSSTINDIVQGEVTVDNKQIDDFILLRSDGSPTYMLAVVVDDYDMGVTHVLRGDDHLNNAFRQKVIYEAMGWELPVYGHLPLIHGADGAKFSKRHGALGVMDYARDGFVKEAVINYLLRLGWGHGDDELFSLEQAVEWFDGKGIQKSPAKFDVEKFTYVNEQKIRTMAPEELLNRLVTFFNADLPESKKQALIKGLPDLTERASTLHDVWNGAQIYIQDLPFDYEDKALKNLKPEAIDTLATLKDRFAGLEDYVPEAIEPVLQDIANDMHEGKFGKVGMPLRAALTGRAQSPALPNVAYALGKDETLKRLDLAINKARENG
jgi:glutamyl-tRNA synthetase